MNNFLWKPNGFLSTNGMTHELSGKQQTNSVLVMIEALWIVSSVFDKRNIYRDRNLLY